jgi:hypothetical protein
MLDRLGSVPSQSMAEIEHALALTLGLEARAQGATNT